MKAVFGLGVVLDLFAHRPSMLLLDDTSQHARLRQPQLDILFDSIIAANRAARVVSPFDPSAAVLCSRRCSSALRFNTHLQTWPSLRALLTTRTAS